MLFEMHAGWLLHHPPLADWSWRIPRARGPIRGESDNKLGASAGLVLGLDRPAVVLDNPSRNHQSQTQAGLLAARERFEEAGQHLAGNAGTGIDHLDNHVMRGEPHRDPQRPTARHRVECVEDEIEEDLLQLGRVGDEIDWPLGAIDDCFNPLLPGPAADRVPAQPRSIVISSIGWRSGFGGRAKSEECLERGSIRRMSPSITSQVFRRSGRRALALERGWTSILMEVRGLRIS